MSTFEASSPLESSVVHMLPPVAQELVQFYSENENIRAIATIGSLAVRNSDQLSDADLVIVCEENGIPPASERMDAINSVGASGVKSTVVMNTLDYRTRVFGHSDDFCIDGQEICTQFFTKEEMRSTILGVINGEYYRQGMEDSLAFLNSVKTAAIVQDKDNFYPQVKGLVDPYPEELKNNILSKELIQFGYFCGRLDQAIERGDMPCASVMVSSAVDSAIHTLFAIAERYPRGPKRLYDQIASVTQEDSSEQIIRCLDELLRTGNDEQNLPRKRQLLDELFMCIQQSSSGDM